MYAALSRFKDELEYHPECKAVGISEVELMTCRGIPTSLMTRGLMVEIHCYVGKYFGGNSMKLYDLFARLTRQLLKARRDAEKITKLKTKNEKFDQFNQVKADNFGSVYLAQKNADDEIYPLIEILRSFHIQVGIPVEVRGWLNH